MKKWLVYLLTALLAISLSPAALAAEPGEVTITILHTNDMHGRILPEDDRDSSIGLPELSAAVQALRQEQPNLLLVDAGDTLHGMPDINISRGENMVDLLNLIGYDFMTPGNHDFNYGSARLQELSRELRFPMLSANVADRRTGKLLFPEWKTVVIDGVRIAVFGLTTPETAYKTSPQNVTNVQFLDPVKTAQRLVKKLRAKHDVIVAITHIGVDRSSVLTSDQLAAAVPDIDVIIDGHSHTELPQGQMVGHTLIAQTGCYDHQLGRVDLVVRDHAVVSRTAQLYTPSALQAIAPVPDARVAQEIGRLKAGNQERFGEVVAHSGVFLPADRGIVRLQESALGDLCADVMRQETGADVGLVNGGSLRADLPAGDVTKGDMMAIFPFGNTMKKIELSGAQLRQVLEYSVGMYPSAFGGFMQVSGIRFAYDPLREAGSRITAIEVNGRPLEADRVYTAALNDYLCIGGDGYTMLEGCKIVGEYGTCEELLTNYLNQHGLQGCSTDGRIERLEAAEEKAAA